MKQSFHNLSDKEKNFLYFLLENGSVSDAEISKRSGISKATCSRIRNKLNKYIIDEYVPIIRLDRAGIDIFVVLMLKWDKFEDDNLTKSVFKGFENDPHTIFLANGQNNLYSTIMFLAFRSIDEYNSYFNDFRKKYDRHISNLNSMILPSKELIKMDFTEILGLVLKEGIKV